MEFFEITRRLVAWQHGEERDDDVLVSPLSKALLEMLDELQEEVSEEWGLGAVKYLERIVSHDPRRADRALSALSLLSNSKNALIAGQALAYVFFYEPTPKRAVLISNVLRSNQHPAYVACLSSVKQVLQSGNEKDRAIAQSAIHRVSDSAIAYAELLLDLKETQS